MASPDPFFTQLGFELDQASGLGIMNKKDISVEVHLLHIFAGNFLIDFEIGRRDNLVPPMKGVMELFGHPEKWVISLDDIPVRIHPQLLQQRHHTIQYFRYSPAGKGRVNVLNNLPFQISGQQLKLLEGAPADNRFIVRQLYLIRFSIT